MYFFENYQSLVINFLLWGPPCIIQSYLFTELCLENTMLEGDFCALGHTYNCATAHLETCYWFPTLFMISFILFVFTPALSSQRCSTHHRSLGFWLPNIFMQTITSSLCFCNTMQFKPTSPPCKILLLCSLFLIILHPVNSTFLFSIPKLLP